MIRHGESVWNLEKKFTGWCDVPLTKHGELDAKDAGVLLGERGLKFDVAFTSDLERAWRTCAIALSAADLSSVEVVRSWKLNERHYGG
jgi:2,3-bisphosphoglycerate-dependent phosphoglycerate mutase